MGCARLRPLVYSIPPSPSPPSILVWAYRSTPPFRAVLVLFFLQVWDVVSPRLCADTLLPFSSAAEATHRLVDLSLARRTTDNVSVVIAALRPTATTAPASPILQQQQQAQQSPHYGGSSPARSPSPGLSLSLSLSPAASVRRPSPMAMFGGAGSPFAMSPSSSSAMGYSPSFAHALQF